MKTKTIFLWLLLALLVGGVNGAWAFRYVAYFGNSASLTYRNDGSTDDYFTFGATHHVQGERYATEDGEGHFPSYYDQVFEQNFTFKTALKMESATSVSFTCSSTATVTILVSTYDTSATGNVATGTVKFDGTELTSPTSTESGYKEYRVENVAAGTHSVTKGSSQAGVFYIRVTDDASMTMTVNYNDLFYGGNSSSEPRIEVSNEFAYVNPEVYRNNSSLEYTYMRVKLNLSSALTNTTDVTVSSDNTSVLLPDGNSWANNEHTQLYAIVKVLGYSSTPVNLTFTHTATGATCIGTFTVNSPLEAYNNSYPYKWDFQNSEWTSTHLTLIKTSEELHWTIGEQYATNKGDINTGVTSGINMIKGLAFGTTAGGLKIDWTNNQVTLAAGSTIKIPGDLSGRVITFDASEEFEWSLEGTVTKMGRNKFYVSSGSDVIFSNASAVDIYSIDVSGTGLATYKTTDGGVFQFTGNGTLAGGTVIRDVPGIEITIGTSGNSITVNNATVSNTDRLTNSSECPPNRGYTFTPTVNGYLTVTVWGAQNLNLYDGDTNYEAGGEINVNGGKTITFTKPLIAGHTYYFVGSHESYPIWLHSFSFEPAYLNTAGTGRQSAESPAVFAATGSTKEFPSILTNANEYVTFAASGVDPSGAITVEANGNGKPTLVTPTNSATTITATVASPNSSVTAKTASYQLTYSATAINLAYQWRQYVNTNFVDGGTYKQDIYAKLASDGTTDVTSAIETWTYASSDESIATVAADGTLTIHNSGEVTITVTATDDNGYYQSATTTYTLTINPTTDVTLTLAKGTNDHSFQFGNDYTNQGSVNVEGPEITYESSTPSVAKVNSAGKVEGVMPSDNWVTITVRSSQYKQYRPQTVTYRVKVEKGTLAMRFMPDAITLNKGEYVTPYMTLNGIELKTIEGKMTVSSLENENGEVALQDPAFVLHSKVEGTGENAKTMLDRVDVKITGGIHGQSTDQVAKVRVTISGSDYYNDVTTECTVTVRATAQQNFKWEGAASASTVPVYTIYQGDFMLIPNIDGNCSHNNSYSVASNGKYAKKINSNQTANMNDSKDYYAGEGVPDYMIVNAASGGEAPAAGTTPSNDYAYVLFAQSENSRTQEYLPDALMLYAKINNETTDKVVYLRAQDSNNSDYYCDAKIIIKPKSDLDSKFAADVASMSFPFTWDFTQFSSADLDLVAADKVYYGDRSTLSSSNTGYYLNTGYMNWTNYLVPGSNKTASVMKSSNLYFQNMVVRDAEGSLKTLKPFKGLKICINGTYYNSKIDRVRINAASPYLYFNGGPAEILLPSVASAPANFKVFVKIKGKSGKPMYFKQGDNSLVTQNLTGSSEPEVVSFDATNSGGAITLRFQDASVYWIAASTEAKPIYQPTSTTYPASTYSYTKALDLDKSAEVNTGLTTYYASGFNSSTNSVTMTSLTGRVEANRGLMLKLPATNETNDYTPSSSCYMIADPENSESYSVPTTLNNVTNYLIATGNTSTTPKRFYPENTHDNTNFILTNTYHKILDNTETDEVTSTSDAITDDWKYVRTAGDIEVGAYKAYLRLPGRLLNINASARAMSESSADSRTVLNIVFDDEQNATGVQSLHTASKVGSDNDGWHTLQGVKVSTPTRGGLYIYKGKKIAVK